MYDRLICLIQMIETGMFDLSEYKNVITIGNKGTYEIDRFNKTFEYEYNLYHLNTNETNLMYSKTIAIAILVYIGFDISYLT